MATTQNTSTKSAFQTVLETAFPYDEKLRLAASFEATYTRNHRATADSARSAVPYVRQALAKKDPTILASPTAQAVMTEWLDSPANLNALEMAQYNPTFAIEGWLAGYEANGDTEKAVECKQALDLQKVLA